MWQITTAACHGQIQRHLQRGRLGTTGVFTCMLSFAGRDAHLMMRESARIHVFLKRCRPSVTQDVNRWLTDSQMCHRVRSPRWSYGWFRWFKEKTRWGWVGVFLWPQRLINNLPRTPPGSLVEADDSQVRGMQLARKGRGIRRGRSVRSMSAALLLRAWVFSGKKYQM